MDAITDYLDMVITMYAQMKTRQPRLSVEAFVREHGRAYPDVMPFDEVDAEYGLGEPRNCYADALNLAMSDPDLTYVEGYAVNAFLPVLHAWVVDPDGRVIDTTWAAVAAKFGRGDGDRAYFGIAMPTEQVAAWSVGTGMYGVLGNEDSNVARVLREGLDATVLRPRLDV